MKLTLVNITDETIADSLLDRVEGTGKEVTIFDWCPTDDVNNAVAVQIKEMKRCQDNQIPVIVFDRYSSMKQKEVLFLHTKTKAVLLEPSIISRPGFEFMPYWIHFKEFSYIEYDSNRKYQTGYKGNNFTDDLERNIVSLVRENISIGLDTKLPQEKYNILKSIVCVDKFEFSDLESMLITGTDEDYRKGRLPDIRLLMYNSVIPMLYHKHKWLHSLFKHFIVYDNEDIKYFMRMYKNCGCGMLEDVQENILEYLPEMESHNFVDCIIKRARSL